MYIPEIIVHFILQFRKQFKIFRKLVLFNTYFTIPVKRFTNILETVDFIYSIFYNS